MRFRPLSSLPILPALLLAGAPLSQLHAQQAALPDAPSAMLQAAQTTQQQDAPPAGPHQTKRILGIVPNFRAVSADQKLPPQTVKQKFASTVQQSFDYSDVIFVGLVAGTQDIGKNTPEFGHGAIAYGRYYWHTAADQTTENFFVQAIFPSILHQDSRYYTLGHGGLPKRAAYAFTRVLITRDDNSHEDFNYSEIAGAAFSSALSNAYYPGPERTWTKTGQRWLVDVLIDGGTYMFQEVWPDLNSKLFHQKS